MVHSETSDSVENVGSASSSDQSQLRLHMYEQMLKIRVFEEHVNVLHLSAKMPGLAHLYTGEEAVAVGVCEALHRLFRDNSRRNEREAESIWYSHRRGRWAEHTRSLLHSTEAC